MQSQSRLSFPDTGHEHRVQRKGINCFVRFAQGQINHQISEHLLASRDRMVRYPAVRQACSINQSMSSILITEGPTLVASLQIQCDG